MKKYKLIKEYPGSPELGTIAEKHSLDGIAYTYAGKTIYEASSESGLFKRIVSTQPEFWEEIIEKDYEILSFKQDSKCSDLWTKFGHGWCRNSNGKPVTYPYSDDQILNNHLRGGIKYYIYSVKRLSDFEVFTVGDKITGATYNEPRNIISFGISDNKLYIKQDHGDSDLKDIKKLKQPLFTTEDGVDIYEGDASYSVDSNTFSIMRRVIFDKCQLCSTLKYFSTETAAEEYVLRNKPCLSINDIIKHTNFSFHTVIEELKTKVKSKLNK